MIQKTVFILVLLSLIHVCASNPAWADCTYNVTGNIMVLDPATTEDHIVRPLEKVKVLVKADTGGGWSAPWDTVYTNGAGHFSISASKTCASRRYLVQVKLDNNDLIVSPTMGWKTIFQMTDKISDTSVAVGELIFGRPSSAESRYNQASVATTNLADEWTHDRAFIWYILKTSMDYLGNFKRKITVHYPIAGLNNIGWDTTISLTSAWNGLYSSLTGELYSSPSGMYYHAINGTLHELTHCWFAQQLSGPLPCVVDPSTDRSANCTPHIFNEGFARFSSVQLMKTLWNKIDPTPTWSTDPLPAKRAVLANDGPNGPIPDMDVLITDIFGAMNALNMLIVQDIYAYRFGTADDELEYPDENAAERVGVPPLSNCPDAPNLTYKEVLNTFIRTDVGISGNSDWSVLDFYDKVSSTNARFTAEMKDMYLEMTDPEATAEPYSHCGENQIIIQ